MVNFKEALFYSWKIAIANILSDLIFSSTFKDHLKKKKIYITISAYPKPGTLKI